MRSTMFGYQYSEILRSLMCVYFCDGKERIFDDMINGFGWNRLPKSFMAQNTVFLLMTALIRNFYKAIMQRLRPHDFGSRHQQNQRLCIQVHHCPLLNGLKQCVGIY